MVFDRKLLKIPTVVKYSLLSTIIAFVIIILMNSGIPHSFCDRKIVIDFNDASKSNLVMKGKNKVNLDGQARCFDSRQQLTQSTHHDVQAFNFQDSENLSLLYMMSSFSKVLSFLSIKTFVIEPKILYCMLETKYQKLLKKRNFNISSSLGSPNIVTLGVFQSDVPSLLNRSLYLWHAALKLDENLNIPRKEDLLFTDYDSAYENFSLEPIASKNLELSNIFIPSDHQHFVFQIPNSRFLECNLTKDTIEVKQTSDSELEKFKKKTIKALDELKTLFKNLLMHFWIFSGTMLGWYRECGLIPFTSDVDFGAWASEVDDLDYLIKHFQNNTKLTIRERMGMLEEALEFQLRCDGLRVDVFFMYKINNGSWASGHRPSRGYYFRYYYPHFSLCSAELLGQKVQVPCETEDVIETEYGPNWTIPVSSWYYESSIFNRGPNIYWDDKRRPKAFQEF